VNKVSRDNGAGRKNQVGRRKQQDVDPDYHKNVCLGLMFMHGFQSRRRPGVICGMVILELGDSTADGYPKAPHKRQLWRVQCCGEDG
jgi:hypothetical protein